VVLKTSNVDKFSKIFLFFCEESEKNEIFTKLVRHISMKILKWKIQYVIRILLNRQVKVISTGHEQSIPMIP